MNGQMLATRASGQVGTQGSKLGTTLEDATDRAHQAHEMAVKLEERLSTLLARLRAEPPGQKTGPASDGFSSAMVPGLSMIAESTTATISRCHQLFDAIDGSLFRNS